MAESTAFVVEGTRYDKKKHHENIMSHNFKRHNVSLSLVCTVSRQQPFVANYDKTASDGLLGP